MPDSTPPNPQQCDVLIVGGGPAGSTAANLLARRGLDVALFEKECHPRFHIGESLLPANVALFDALGLRAQIERIGMIKRGAEFVSPTHEHRSYIEFADAWDKSMPYAWQVRRADMDELLFRAAHQAGARTHEEATVRSARFDATGVDVVVEHAGAQQSWRCKYLVDASGRDTLLAQQLGSKRKNRAHNSAALFGHFSGAERLPEGRAGDISILWFDHGWFWFIPLQDGSTSVGAVCWPYYLKTRGHRSLQEFFMQTIAQNSELARRLRAATLIDDKVHATGNYSYSSTHCSGERYLMLGDAYAFIDPVFSSGVYLAMKSAFAAIDLIEASVIGLPRLAQKRRAFERWMRFGPRTFGWFIYRVTNPTMREFFMYPRNVLRTKEALISLLAGDIYERTPIWRSLFALKLLYYTFSLANFHRSIKAWRMRRVNIRPVEIGS